ncbi:MAG: aromatic ring-hydroxylating dioxygenase subunit alpha [Gammaproteobacteria bacterium]|nr:aromatic ring-hydroxylating dioxygenase subunit alpha [Gammaproteobacteria bacterium]
MNAPDPKQFTQNHPELGCAPLSTRPNISPEYFELEREKIFKKSWLNVGRMDMCPNPGDYYVKDIAILNTSLIIVHGQDGIVRAFHNACPHRGNKVAQGKGNTKGFACGFHGWTFDNQGALVFVPDEEQFFDFDKKAFCLKPVSCDTWSGFIFINAEANPAEDLKTALGGMAEQLEGFPFDQLTVLGSYQADVKVNWKVIIDAFQESYHAAFVHRTTAGDALAAKDDPYMHCNSFRLYEGGHRSTSCPVNLDHQPWTTEALAARLAPSIWVVGDKYTWKGANPEGHDSFLFDINVLFPNFFIDVANGWCFTYNFWPVSVDETHYEVSYFMTPPTNAGEKISKEYSKVQFRDLLREDLSTVEACQAAMMSGALETMILSDQELLVRHQYKVVDDIVNS